MSVGTFKQEVYDENDPKAKQALRSYLDSKGIPTVIHEDYGPDIKAFQEVFHEVEVKKIWHGEWPNHWKEIRIPARKKRLMEGGRRIVFWVLNDECTRAFCVHSQEMKDEYIAEFPNSWKPEGELFYNLPLDIGKFVDITTEVMNS